MQTNDDKPVTLTLSPAAARFIQWVDDFNPRELYISLHHTIQTGIVTWRWPEDDPDTMPTDKTLSSWYNLMQLQRELFDFCIYEAEQKGRRLKNN